MSPYLTDTCTQQSRFSAKGTEKVVQVLARDALDRVAAEGHVQRAVPPASRGRPTASASASSMGTDACPNRAMPERLPRAPLMADATGNGRVLDQVVAYAVKRLCAHVQVDQRVL